MVTVPQSHFFRAIHLLMLGILGLVIFSLSGCANTVERTNVDLTSGNTSACTSSQLDEWNFIQSFQMGVAGRDPVGEQIGSIPAKSHEGGPWAPYGTRKTTLCGILHHFDITDGWHGIGDEMDWNNYIVPSEVGPFRRLLTDPIAFGWADINEIDKCFTGHDCIGAEITPDEDFYGNSWFPKVYGGNEDSSYLEGQQICTYGPWVADTKHGNKPEIHPSELYWFQEPDLFSGGTLTTLMLLQDDAERFERASGFDLPDTPPEGWRPWSASPRTGEFRLAFDITVGPLGSVRTLNFDVNEIEAKNVVTSDDPNARLDADNGKDHAITYNGQTGVQLRELQQNDDDIGVQFKDVCRIDDPVVAKTRLQGYVTLTGMAGKEEDGNEGYQVLDVHMYEGGSSTSPVVPTPIEVVSTGKILPETIHPSIIGDKIEILADLQISSRGRPDVKESDLKIVKVEHVTEDQRQRLAVTSLQLDSDSHKFQAIVKDVPVASGAKLELSTESGKVLYLSAPPVSLAPAIISETPLQTSSDPMSWNALVLVAGGTFQESIPPPDQLQKVSKWELEVTPVYAPFKNGKAYLEDDSVVAEELNQIISQDDISQLKSFFGSERPFSVEWSYQAKNLTTGEMIPVNIAGNPKSTEVQVQMLQDQAMTESLNVIFPQKPENAIFELTVTAKMTDTLGNTSEVQHMLWSHVLSEQDKNKLVEYIIPTVAVLVGVSPNDLLTAEHLDLQANEKRIPPDSKQRIGEMLRLIAIQAAEDQRISLTELASLIRGARLFGSG